jgi:hypothetical protein
VISQLSYLVLRLVDISLFPGGTSHFNENR